MLRGLVSEVMSLAGWVVAWLLSQAWALDVAAALHIGEPGGQIARLSGLVITFVATLLAWRVLTWLLQQVIHATPLAPLDRLLGAAFGVLRGGLILLVAVMMLGLTPMARQPSWQAATGGHCPVQHPSRNRTPRHQAELQRIHARHAIHAAQTGMTAPSGPVSVGNFLKRWSERCVASSV
jgi:membrane protein required for colicin V production